MVRNEKLRNQLQKNKMKRRFFSSLPRLKWLGVAILVGIFLFVSFSFILPATRLVKEVLSGPMDIGSLVSQSKPQVKQDNNRVNILLLGVGDANHDGINLTDTMILVSLDLKSYDLALISIPRDTWIDSLQDKINSAYALGEEKQKGAGLERSQTTVSNILGIPVHYAVRVNFTGFKKAIDLVNGITINVDNTFDDYLFPVEGKESDLCDGDPDLKCRYEHLHFDKGIITMNGTLALKYVRSRYAEGDEGTDFARSKRQQKVILALKDKILTPKTILDPNKIRELLKIFGDNIETDIASKEIDDFVKIGVQANKNLRLDKIRSFTLDTGDEKTGRVGLLINPPTWQYGAWVLIPATGDGNWKEIQSEVNTFLYGASITPSVSP